MVAKKKNKTTKVTKTKPKIKAKTVVTKKKPKLKAKAAKKVPVTKKKAVAKKTAPIKKAGTKPKVKTKAKPKPIPKSRAVTKKTQKTTTITKRTPMNKKVTTTTKSSTKNKAANESDLNFAPYNIAHEEEYMNDEQRKHFQKILELWKHQLMQEVDTTVGHMREDASVAYPDMLDRAAQEEGFNLELRTRDRERRLIEKIDQALVAIKNGEYGYCEDCGAEIGIRRLEARPTADKCIDCKTFEEIKEKQVGV